MIFLFFYISLVLSRDIVVEYYRTPVDSPHPHQAYCDPEELEGIYYFKRKTCNCFMSKILEYYSGDCYMMNFISHDVLRTDVYLSTNQNCSLQENKKYGFDVLIFSEVKDNCTHSFVPSHDKHIHEIESLSSFFEKYTIDHTDYIKKYYSTRNCKGEIIEVVIDREEAQDHDDCPKQECVNTVCGGSVLIECIEKELPPEIVEIIEEEITLPWVWGVLIFIGVAQIIFWMFWVIGAIYFSFRSLFSYIDQQRREYQPEFVSFPRVKGPPNNFDASSSSGTTLFTSEFSSDSSFGVYPREYYKEVFRSKDGHYYSYNLTPELVQLRALAIAKKRKKKKRKRRFSAPISSTTTTSSISSESMKYYNKKKKKPKKNGDSSSEDFNTPSSLDDENNTTSTIGETESENVGTTASNLETSTATAETTASGVTESTGESDRSSDSSSLLESETSEVSDTSGTTSTEDSSAGSKNSDDESSFWDGTD